MRNSCRFIRRTILFVGYVCLILFISTNIPIVYSSGNIQQKFEEANKMYEQSNYDSAISLYESIIMQNVINSSLFYNLGDAYYHKNEIGKARLWYERAKKISPRDGDIENNLKFVRSFVQEPEEGFLSKAFGFVLINELTVFGSLFYFLFIAGLTISLFYKNDVLKLVNSITGTIFILCFLWFLTRIYAESKYVSGIIITNTEARNGPGEDYSVGFTLPEGKKVRILSEKSGWYAVETLQVKPEKILIRGWIPKLSAKKI